MTDGLSLLKKMNQDATMYDSATQMKDQAWQMREADIEDTTQNDEEITRIREQLVQQLMVDTEILDSQQLFAQYPTLVLKARKEQARLQTDASRTGAEKRENDRFATKKVSAKWKLWRTESKKSKLEKGRYGAEVKAEQRTGKVRSAFLKIFNGTEESRRSTQMDTFSSILYGSSDQEGDDVFIQGYEGKNLPVQRKNVSFAGGDLKGCVFEPANYDQQTGKILIYYTGSGEPGLVEKGVGETMQTYLRQGFKVYQVDYRGYGKSAEGKDVAFSEAGFYEDGMQIYQSVLADAQCSASQIVMHGYSMGGAVASYVAGKVAQDAAKQYHGKENVPADQKLGGLILDSPMASLTKAAKGAIPVVGGIGGAIASTATGSYSAEDHLGTLFQNQPDIPIMFVGGGEDDHLSLGKTEIDRKYHFNQDVLTFSTDTGHESAHMTDENLRMFRQRYHIPDPRDLTDDDMSRVLDESRQRRRQRTLEKQQQLSQQRRTDQ